ncbi:RTX toxin acyltransferase family protein [Vibrio sp. ES.051]|uniref:toxin-activating lysine-acyltransferase n=1 Tax=Vibrio sp. ES.051 TaxID=1761909 RepID=UPI000BF9ED87|nr:toxin-activating lysine-acyltransferase [Vibrio sp. ES.051]PFG56475.1 RTX toxin acyltransferase family protein [Vibrio sp. ES.051]
MCDLCKPCIGVINEKFIGHRQKGKYKQEVFQELGQFLEVSAKIADRSDINVRSFLHWVKPAILHDQYFLLKNEGDLEPFGYVLWAWVSKKTLNKYLTQKRFALHPMCWNEGEHLIIVDLAITDNTMSKSVVRSLYQKARKDANVSFKQINICIRDNYGLITKHNRKYSYV